MSDIRVTGSHSNDYIALRKNIYDNIVKENDALRKQLDACELALDDMRLGRAIADNKLDIAREALNVAHNEVRHIQGSQKASIGSIDNAYLPQINRDGWDLLVKRLRDALEKIGG
jgi:hypothetical protein